MHEDKLYELKEKLIKELEEYAQNGKYSKEDVETIKYMASAVDHICNIVERDDEGYSERGGSYADGRTGGSYRDGGYSRNMGGSYRGGYSRNYGGGSYARGRGQNARRDSMGRYSRDGSNDMMVQQLEDLMQDAPNEQIKQQIQQLVQQIEQM